MRVFAFKFSSDGYFKFYANQEEVDNEDPFLQMPEAVMDQVFETVYGIKINHAPSGSGEKEK